MQRRSQTYPRKKTVYSWKILSIHTRKVSFYNPYLQRYSEQEFIYLHHVLLFLNFNCKENILKTSQMEHSINTNNIIRKTSDIHLKQKVSQVSQHVLILHYTCRMYIWSRFSINVSANATPAHISSKTGHQSYQIAWTKAQEQTSSCLWGHTLLVL